MFLFFFLRVFYILEEERVLNDNAITTVASCGRWLHGCVHGLVTTQGFFDWFLMGEMERLASVGVKVEEVQISGDLD